MTIKNKKTIMVMLQSISAEWNYWLKWGETSLAVFRLHVPLHNIFSTKGFLANGTEPTHVNSSGAECRLRKRKNVEHLYRFSGHKIPLFSSSTTTATIAIVFPPLPPPPPHFHCFLPPPPPPPHFHCFPSTTATTATTTLLLFSLHEIL